MTDLHERFRALDHVPAPYLWNEIERRAGQPATAMSVVVSSPIQRRPRLAPHSRSHAVQMTLKVATVAVIVLAVGLGLGRLLPSAVTDVGVDPSPTSSPVAPAIPLREGWLPAGTYVSTPFAQPGGLGLCLTPPQPGCVESTEDDGIRFTLTLPDGWAGAPHGGVEERDIGPNISFERGGWLHVDPCGGSGSPLGAPEIPVGPTVDDFVAALVDHPLLVVSTPVDVTLGGYSGTYVDLTVSPDVDQHRPLDLPCNGFKPWSPGIYKEAGLWILDVDGHRVIVRSEEDPEDSPEARAQLQAVIDSITIDVQPADPLATPGARLPCQGGETTLTAGRYVIPGPGTFCSNQSRGWPDKTVTIELPAGWVYRAPVYGSWLYRDSAKLQIGVVDHVYADPCHAGSAVGPTQDDLIAALRGVQTTTPDAITLDGYSGVRMDLAIPTDPPDCEPQRLWDAETDNGRFGPRAEPGWIHRMWILDVEGVRFVLDASRAPDAPPEVQAELDAIVESVDFEP